MGHRRFQENHTFPSSLSSLYDKRRKKKCEKWYLALWDTPDSYQSIYFIHGRVKLKQVFFLCLTLFPDSSRCFACHLLWDVDFAVPKNKKRVFPYGGSLSFIYGENEQIFLSMEPILVLPLRKIALDHDNINNLRKLTIDI